MAKSRTSHEAEALDPFQRLLKEKGIRGFTGQGNDNLLQGPDGVLFQFGDLRVETVDTHLIVEVESGGGVTNLVKYWYCLDKSPDPKPIRLIHLFRKTSDSDYRSHRELWDFLCRMMQADLGDRFEARIFTYRIPDDLQEALDLFARWLA